MREKLVRWVAWKLPRSVAYWCFVRVAVYGRLDFPGDRTVHEVMEAWEDSPREDDRD